tara:strand:- start:258 stop:506 length:249 start_codon:yes stop_codon:yes gene_type:complete
MKKQNRELLEDVRNYITKKDKSNNNSVQSSVNQSTKSSKKVENIEIDLIRKEVKSWIKTNGEVLASKIIHDYVKDVFKNDKT